jgi:hypothetical protein
MSLLPTGEPLSQFNQVIAATETSSTCQELQDILTSRRRAYEAEPPRILEDFRNEVSTTAAYNGRQLLELLQNADDAARHQTRGPRRLLLRLTSQELVAANTGVPFSAKGIRSVLFANLSAKYGEPGYIGAKGLGFRALLNWSPHIRIDSGPLHVAFAPEIAHAFLDKLRAARPEVARTLADEPERYPIAILRCPAECPALANSASEEYDTTITLDLRGNPEAVPHIQAQLSALTAEVLIFLQHLDEVVIESPTMTRTLRCLGRGTVTLHTSDEETSCTWQIFNYHTNFEGVDYQLRAAWNADWAATSRASWLHVFFPTRVALPFPLLLHGPFEVSSNRDFLLNDPAGRNRHLLAALTALVIHVAETLRQLTPTDAFGPLRLVWDRGQPLQHGQDNFDFAAELRRRVQTAALLPRLDGSFGTLADTLDVALPVACFLPAAACPTLLAHPRTEADRLALNGVLGQVGRPPRLPLPALLTAIAAARTQLPAADYAQLLVLLTQQLKAERLAPEGLLLPPLFTSREGEALAPSLAAPVFLPPDEADGIAPPVPVRVLAPSQALALREAFQAATFAELAGKLAGLHVRAYAFVELMRAVVQRYAAGPAGQLHGVLFAFFQAERRRLGIRPVAERPATLAVPLPTVGRKGKPSQVRPGHELYFGKAHGYELCEELYHYDANNKIVADRAALNLDGEKPDEVSAYLRWCGVADEPRLQRRQLTAQEAPYREFVLRFFDYRRLLGGEHVESYAKLARLSPQMGECWVTTVDDLSLILHHSRRLITILEWAYQPGELSTHLAQSSEAKDSYLEILFGQQQYFRRVPGPQLASFLAWQFATTRWLRVDGWPEREAPACTVLSPTIGPEFRPHLFRLPAREARVPAASLLFTSYPAYKQALLRVGVRETIESVDVGLIYKVLNLLPSLDPDGRVATSLYRELAENFTWRTEYAEHEHYAHFCRHGRVWCRLGTTESYQPVTAVHYLPTQELPPALRGLFQLLALTPGYEGSKVQVLLGVAPLPPPVLHLAGDPQLHPLQVEFDDDWQHLRPYLYAFRLGKSSREESLRRLRELHIRLCLTLPAVYEDEHGRHALGLAPYSFLFPGKGNRREAWLLVPAATISLAQLQQEPDAGEAMARLVCIALDTVADKAYYELLFGASRSRRDGILRNKLPNLEATGGLAEARQQLAYTTQTMQAFWQQLAYATGTRRQQPLPATPEAWQPWLLHRFPPATTLLPTILADLDWEALEHSAGLLADDLTLLWQLFETLGLEPARFQQAGRLRLDFTLYYEREYAQQRDTHRPAFEAALRAQLENAALAAQQAYLTTVEQFLRYAPPASEISPRRPPALVWTAAVSRVFNLPADWSACPLGRPTRFEANQAALLAYGADHRIPAPYISSFLREDLRRRSLLYFEQLTWLQQALQASYQPPATARSGAETASNHAVELGSRTYHFNSWRELRDQLATQPLPTGGRTADQRAGGPQRRRLGR